MCLSRSRLPTREQNKNKQRECLRFSELDWLINQSGKSWSVCGLNNRNNLDNLTPPRNVLRLIFVDWANLTAVIASNLHPGPMMLEYWSLGIKVLDQCRGSLWPRLLGSVTSVHKWVQNVASIHLAVNTWTAWFVLPGWQAKIAQRLLWI